MVEVTPIEEILIHVDPDLDYYPDWLPKPDPPRELGPLGGKTPSWSDIFDWVKTHAILPRGVPITDFGITADQVQQMIDASTGTLLKALSGFINQSAAMTFQAANLLDDALTNLDTKETGDYLDLSTRIDTLNNQMLYIINYAFPLVETQIAQARTEAQADALHAQANAQLYAVDNIFNPLIERITNERIVTNQQVADTKAGIPTIVHQVVAGAGLATVTALATVAVNAKKATDWIDDCGEPMCQNIGPKTDLGKLLKALKLATDVALLAELANLNSDRLAALIRSLTAHVTGIVDTFSELFVADGKTIGDVVTASL